MYGLQSVKILGVRIDSELNEQLEQAAKKLKANRPAGFYGSWTQSEIARRILKEFFSGESEFKKQFNKICRRVPAKR